MISAAAPAYRQETADHRLAEPGPARGRRLLIAGRRRSGHALGSDRRSAAAPGVPHGLPRFCPTWSSPIGSIWTTDADAAIRIGDRVATGTWFMNRCDYLDPALAWTGVKDSGRGCSLSRLQYERSPVRSRSICARRPDKPQPRGRLSPGGLRESEVRSAVGDQASRGTPFGPSTMSNSARLAPLLACGSRSGAGSRRTLTRIARSPRRR